MEEIAKNLHFYKLKEGDREREDVIHLLCWHYILVKHYHGTYELILFLFCLRKTQL